MTLDILTFVFKNVAPVLIILLIGIVALNNFGNLFRNTLQKEEEEEEETPQFDPYLMLQQNQTTQDDFYQKEIQFTSALDRKKSEIINQILANPDEAARLISSYIKE